MGIRLNPKFVIAGSDAHGEFNKALGKAKTYIYLPNGTGKKDILLALEKGNSIITDGPFLSFEIIGKHIGETLESNSPIQPELKITWKSTEEFGKIEQIKIIKNGSWDPGINDYIIKPSETAELDDYDNTDGIYVVQDPVLVNENTYYRLELTTSKGYKAYTNPIFLQFDQDLHIFWHSFGGCVVFKPCPNNFSLTGIDIFLDGNNVSQFIQLNKLQICNLSSGYHSWQAYKEARIIATGDDLFIDKNLYTVYGHVQDVYGSPISNALVLFTDEGCVDDQDFSKYFAYTNHAGYYSAQIPKDINLTRTAVVSTISPPYYIPYISNCSDAPSKHDPEYPVITLETRQTEICYNDYDDNLDGKKDCEDYTCYDSENCNIKYIDEFYLFKPRNGNSIELFTPEDEFVGVKLKILNVAVNDTVSAYFFKNGELFSVDFVKIDKSIIELENNYRYVYVFLKMDTFDGFNDPVGDYEVKISINGIEYDSKIFSISDFENDITTMLNEIYLKEAENVLDVIIEPHTCGPFPGISTFCPTEHPVYSVESNEENQITVFLEGRCSPTEFKWCYNKQFFSIFLVNIEPLSDQVELCFQPDPDNAFPQDTACRNVTLTPLINELEDAKLYYYKIPMSA